MTLDEFRRLNPREVGSWPWLPKIVVFIAVFVGILVAAWFVEWSGQLDALDAAQQEEEKLKTTFLEKKAQAVNLDLYVQQLKDIEQAFSGLLRQLPNKSEMDALLTDINQAGLGRGLQFELFKPAGPEKFADFYAEQPISIKVTGSYHDFGAFASDVAQLPRIVTLGDLSIGPSKDGLTLEATARTFRYLDEEEIAKQRKTAKDAKDAKDGKGQKK